MPTREELARLDRKRRSSIQDWEHPHDPGARITKMKDGTTHLAHTEHAVNMGTGTVVAVTVQGADQGDTTTMKETFIEAAEQMTAVGEEATADEPVNAQGLEEVVTDKGYHNSAMLVVMRDIGVRSYIPEPRSGTAHFSGSGSSGWAWKISANGMVTVRSLLQSDLSFYHYRTQCGAPLEKHHFRHGRLTKLLLNSL